MGGLIQVDNLSKTFRVPKKTAGLTGAIKHLFQPKFEDKVAVDSVSFDIQAGESVAFIGPNGAGKSTTIKALVGIIFPSRGSIRVNGVVPFERRLENNRHIGVVFGQRTQLWWDLPVRESLRLLADIYQVPAEIYTRNMEEFSQLLDIEMLLEKPARYLSLGQRMRCDLAASFLHSPNIVYLDEPTIGLDVAVKARVRKFLRFINRERGTTILLASHDLKDIEEVCDRLLLIDKGRIVYDGDLKLAREWLGTRREIRIVLDKPVVDVRPLLDGLLAAHPEYEVVETGPMNLTLRLEQGEAAAGDVIKQVVSRLAVHDLRIVEPDIESVIQRLFEGQLAPRAADTEALT